MRLEGRPLRPLRNTLVGLANGVSLVFLAVLVTAYGSGTGVPFTSVDGFLSTATVWAFGPREPTLGWALGYLGVAVLVVSPVWFLVVSPLARGLLDIEFSTAPIERREGSDSADRSEEKARATRIDETGTGFVRGGAADGESRKFSLEDATWEEQAGRDDGGG
jgi:hypothetical protein